MIISFFAIALLQLSPQQEVAQKAYDNQPKEWIEDHKVELKQHMDRMNRIRALTYDQALVVYDQCLARAAASLNSVAPDDVFHRAQLMCLPLRIDLLNGRPSQWFLGFNDLDAAKRASFPALTRELRERMGAQAAVPGTSRPHD